MERTALVTGANQGLGLALTRRLARLLGPSGLVYLGARDPARGAAAGEQLRREGLEATVIRLDVGDDASVQGCAAQVAVERGGLDILISNAGARITPDAPAASQVDEFINVNNRGTTRLLRTFEPLLRPGARVVVVASGFGSLRNIAPPLQPRFDTSRLRLEDVDGLMLDYAARVKAGTAAQAGWPDWINVPSKVAQVASVRIFARRFADDPRRLVVNAACPGLVDTEASRPWFEDMSRAQSPDQAANDVVWLATEVAREAGPYGELVQHRRVIAWL